MKKLISQAQAMIAAFKGPRYVYGSGAINQIGPLTARIGRRALLVSRLSSEWLKPALNKTLSSLNKSGIEILGPIQGAAPNAPREDVYRIQGHILHKKPDVIVSVESGSGIDACKAAATLATFGDIEAELDPYFGVGEVSKLCQRTGRTVLPIVAAMTAASSSAHLTKYANITNPVLGQKKLIVDEAIVPPAALFDYTLTLSQPMSLTLDGGMDGFSHCLEVYYGATGKNADKIEEIALLGIELIVSGLGHLASNHDDMAAREQVALGTDLGGYAIMVGGTNGPHLNSFSLVSYLSHGRACALMNPYYTVFFAPAVKKQIRKIGAILQRHGYIDTDFEAVPEPELGRVAAEGMLAFNRHIGFPTTLGEIEGIDQKVIAKILQAAKDPQLEMKLKNMPVPLSSELVDEYMGPILEAAWSGEINTIVTRDG